MLAPWYTTRWWDWCLPENEKPITKKIFNDKLSKQ